MAIEKYLWVERYRPHKIDDCVLPDRLKKIFKGFVKKGQIENICLIGSPGTGKTTVARAMCEEMELDHLVINASRERNIDTIRTQVVNFASTMSFISDTKVIILDEADGLTSAAQQSLRGTIEEFSSTCRFIFTGNYGNQIIEAIRSRCPNIEFAFSKEEKAKLFVTTLQRLSDILKENNVTFNMEHVALTLKKFFPDLRKTLGVLQRSIEDGKLDIGGLNSISDDSVKEVVSYLKAQEFTKMRKWVVDNLDNDFSLVQRALYDRLSEIAEVTDQAALVLLLSQYDERNSRAMDKEINLVAMLTEIMVSIKFK